MCRCPGLDWPLLHAPTEVPSTFGTFFCAITEHVHVHWTVFFGILLVIFSGVLSTFGVLSCEDFCIFAHLGLSLFVRPDISVLRPIVLDLVVSGFWV